MRVSIRLIARCSWFLALGGALFTACSSDPPAPPFAGPAGGAGLVAGSGAIAGAIAGASATGGGGTPVTQAGAGGALSNGGGGAANAGAAGGVSNGGAPGFANGALAAVSLTYDDGLDTHLATVIPALDKAGLKGTFFLSNFEGVDHKWALPNLKDPLLPRHLAWQAAGAEGHELADHTVNHPCNSASKAANYHLTDYDLPRMSAELDDSIARLKRLGAAEPITFGYPCMSDKIGLGPAPGTDYSPLVAARFLAARVSDAGIASPGSVDLLHVPLGDAGSKTGDQLKAMVDQAIAAKGWLVFIFHGVGPEQLTCPGDLVFDLKGCMINYLTTDTAAHQALVDYLAEKKAQVWTAPFGTVAKSLKK
jgi:peptidoglycan/xylan/chitin deacetylase (PgdA/CDA1 family)